MQFIRFPNPITATNPIPNTNCDAVPNRILASNVTRGCGGP